MDDENSFSEEQLKILATLLEKSGGIDNFLKTLERFNLQKFQKQIVAEKRFENYAELLKYSVRERWGTLSTVSVLAAALLIIATFNQEIILLNNIVRVLLSILLVLIPICLWGFFFDLGKAQKHSFEQIKIIVKDISGKDIEEQMRKEKKFTIIGLLPFIANSVLTIIIVIIIFLIWYKI